MIDKNTAYTQTLEDVRYKEYFDYADGYILGIYVFCTGKFESLENNGGSTTAVFKETYDQPDPSAVEFYSNGYLKASHEF